MVPIVKQLCPPERYGIKCPYTRRPDRIVVHNTANDAPAVNEITYMINRGDEISFHVAVDDKEIRQGLPFDRNAWASGDGLGRGNMYGIHIEICYSLSGGEQFIQAEKNAAEYIASLLKEYGWGLGKVTKHQDYDEKYCPHRTLDMGWQRFLNMIDKFLKEDDDMTAEEVKKIVREEFERLEKERAAKEAGKWAKPALEYCRAEGLMAGDGSGNMRPRSYVERQELAQVLYNQRREGAGNE